MSFTTFSGPIRAGTVKDGTAVTGRNTGLVILAQVYDSGDLTGTVQGTVDTRIATIPAGALITDVYIDQVVASATGTTTLSVGSSSGGTQFFGATATTAGGRFTATLNTAALVLAFQTSTTADTAIWLRNVTGTATLTAGRFVVVVRYIQRASNGGMNPTSV